MAWSQDLSSRAGDTRSSIRVIEGRPNRATIGERRPSPPLGQTSPRDAPAAVRRVIMEAMPEIDDLLARLFDHDDLNRATLSKPAQRELPAKVTVEPVEVRGELAYRFTTQLPDRAVHENLAAPAARARSPPCSADTARACCKVPTPTGRCSARRCSAGRRRGRARSQAMTGGSATCSRRARRCRSWSSSA